MRKFKLLRDIPDHKSDTLFVIHKNSMDIISDLGTFHTNSGWIYSFVKGNLHNPDWFEEVKESKRWRVTCGETYYTIGCMGVEELTPAEDYDFENWNYLIGNYFQTKEQAEEYLEVLKIENQLRGLADWDGNIKAMYVIFINREDDLMVVNNTGVCAGEKYYFKSIESAQAAIDKIGEENLIKYFSYKWY